MLSGPPPVANQTQMLLHAVTAEQNLIWIYNKAMATYSGLAPALTPLRVRGGTLRSRPIGWTCANIT